jgi:hypothetical protein
MSLVDKQESHVELAGGRHRCRWRPIHAIRHDVGGLPWRQAGPPPQTWPCATSPRPDASSARASCERQGCPARPRQRPGAPHARRPDKERNSRSAAPDRLKVCSTSCTSGNRWSATGRA